VARLSGDTERQEGTEKIPQTQPMPLDAVPGFTDWVQTLPKLKPGDHGETPSDPPQDLTEARLPRSGLGRSCRSQKQR
jgi:hypothetical protein